jgi:hypothetical protein
MLLFSVETLGGAFELSDLPKLEEEVARLFRSNAFNITERRLLQEERIAKHPILKMVPSSTLSTEDLIFKRSFLPK